MIDWGNLKQLHAIRKLDTIISRWFELELFFCDSHANLKAHDKIENRFLKMYLDLPAVKESFPKEIKEQLGKITDDGGLLNLGIPHIYGLVKKIYLDDEFNGFIFCYPFLKDNITPTEEGEILRSLQMDREDARSILKNMKKLGPDQLDRARDLLELMSEEIADFQKAKNNRDDIINSLSNELSEKYRFHNIIGKSKSMQKVYQVLEKLKKNESNILIEGENGTGKELVAKAIHFNSPRSKKLFMEVNCSAFNENLLDSELFGHVKGSFTGAIKDKPGLFEIADGGTLFLDEIGDTSLSMQVKLLRVIQEGTFVPVGGNSQKTCDVRIICATNKNLKEMIENKLFREDLYYRLNVINIHLPALRDREGDVPILMEYFLKKKCENAGTPLKSFAKRTKEKFMDYSWPGNVRELENEIERLVALAGDEKILNADSISGRILGGGDRVLTGEKFQTSSGKLRDAVQELEIVMIREGLKRCNFNKSQLARELGISRASLIMKVDKFGLEKKKTEQAA
jgi:two-component system, NtrC family, response regulator HupR/HoxA